MAPVKLVGFARCEAHRHIGMHRNPDTLIAPSLDEPMHAVVGAVISAPAQLLEQPLRRPAFSLRQLGFLLQDLRQNVDPCAELGRGLNSTLVLELGLLAPYHLAHRRARYRQRPHDLLDGAMLLKIGASDLANLLHANHSPKPFPAQRAKGKDADTPRQKGSDLNAKIPLRGSVLQAILHARSAPVRPSAAESGYDRGPRR